MIYIVLKVPLSTNQPTNQYKVQWQATRKANAHLSWSLK